MSINIVMNIPAGIVMGADSGMDLRSPRPVSEQTTDGVTVRQLEYDWWQTRTTQKIFVTSNQIGICVRGWPDPHHIEEFMRVGLLGHESVQEVAAKLQQFIASLCDDAFGGFYVAGHEFVDGHYQSKVVRGDFKGDPETLAVCTDFMSYSGDLEIVDRLIQSVHTGDDSKYSAPQIPFNYFTIHDAVDFADYLISATKSFYRFSYGVHKPCGPTQLLVLTPEKPIWVARHEVREGSGATVGAGAR